MTHVHHRHAAHHAHHSGHTHHPHHAAKHHGKHHAAHHGHATQDVFVDPKGAKSGSAAAFNIARSVLGHNIQQLKYSGPLAKYLDKWPSSHVCCANFVSACLEKAGQITHHEHNDSVRGLAANLGRDHRWSHVSSAHMKPGDVVCFSVPGEGHMAHVEMFAGYKHGVPYFIGSNNVNRDGSQRISEGHVGYHIDAVYHYNG